MISSPCTTPEMETLGIQGDRRDLYITVSEEVQKQIDLDWIHELVERCLAM